MVNTGNLVFLFYDGHERRAESKLARRARAEARRHVRYVWKKIRRQQVCSGYYTWFSMLAEALQRAGYEVRVNDFDLARKLPDHPITLWGYQTIFGKVHDLPNRRVIGPGLFDPLQSAELFEDPRNALFVITCDWETDMYRPYYGDRLRPWFGGYDVTSFKNAKAVSKRYDVLIYDKIYHQRDTLYPQTIEPFLRHLEAQGLSSIIIRYGDYAYDHYFDTLEQSRAMAFFAHSETQGMAYQECLAMNVPICAWDQGRWMDPLAKELSDGPIPATSVPYFDERCGERFNIGTMIGTWDRFWDQVDQYEPRAFILDRLTFARSAEAFLKIYSEVRSQSA